MSLVAQASTASGDKHRVMVVDDSVVIRGQISRWLDALPDVEVVASCRNGQEAVERLARTQVDVIVLDIEMPIMDGLTALPLILERAPQTKVLMASTLTRRNADISIRAMTMGASDYIPKPEMLRGGISTGDFQRDLVDKVRTLAMVGRSRAGRGRPAVSVAMGRKAEPGSALLKQPERLVLKSASRVPPHIVAIGSSTGGPKALMELLKALAPSLSRVPTVITQHMPPTFTAILAEHLHIVTKLPCCEGAEGMKVEPGHIYIAPGGFHMLLAQRGDSTVIKIDDSPAINFCRPSVDPMMDSLVPIYGGAILGCILTGMGHDGRDGCKHVQVAGGTIIAQDEATSVVWGMPGAVALEGICHKVLPLDQIGTAMSNLIGGRVS